MRDVHAVDDRRRAYVSSIGGPLSNRLLRAENTHSATRTIAGVIELPGGSNEP